MRADATLKELFEESFARFRDRPAFVSMGVALSYGEVDALSRDFAGYLRSDLGLSPGERVAIMLPNLLQYPVALFGALRAGLVVVNVNPLYTATELEFQLADAGAATVVVLENFAHTLAQALPRTHLRHVITTQVGDLFPAPRRWLVNFAVKRVRRMVPAWRIPGALTLRAALARGRGHGLPELRLGAEDLAFLQYTGGTTGRPKGAMLTHGNLVANLEQTRAWSAACAPKRSARRSSPADWRHAPRPRSSRTQSVCAGLAAAARDRGAHRGAVLRRETGPRAARPDVVQAQRPAGQRRERDGRAHQLPAALAVGAVDFYHRWRFTALARPARHLILRNAGTKKRGQHAPR